MDLNPTVELFPGTIADLRNAKWDNNPYVPSWVDVKTASFDQFYTNPDVAIYLYKTLIEWIKNNGSIKLEDYTFLEPSAGMCAFYDLLPESKRTGIDLFPYREGIIQEDFLSWKHNRKKKYITIGNPPFGYRGWLALSFLNKVATFSEYAGFILPMSFQSDGKGSPKHRVKGMKLVHQEMLPNDSFVSPNRKNVKVNALWQIWERGTNQIKKEKTCNDWIDLFTVDMRKERLCGQNRLNEADFFLQRTFFKTPPQPVKRFSEVRYTCGYGVVIKKEKRAIERVLSGINWVKYSNLAAHNCRHISMYHINRAIIDNGYVDGK